MITEAERFNVNHPGLCQCLRWKSMFYEAARDPAVPRSNDGLFWCMYTHNCIGPDGELAEPGSCSSAERTCWGTGRA